MIRAAAAGERAEESKRREESTQCEIVTDWWCLKFHRSAGLLTGVLLSVPHLHCPLFPFPLPLLQLKWKVKVNQLWGTWLVDESRIRLVAGRDQERGRNKQYKEKGRCSLHKEEATSSTKSQLASWLVRKVVRYYYSTVFPVQIHLWDWLIGLD